MRDTLAPARNFALTFEQRLAAAVNGPPPYTLRLRRIEDARARLVAELAKAGEAPAPAKVLRGLEELNRLIHDHNRYYPIERNLPLDVSTGELLFRGERWTPLALVTLAELQREAGG